MPPGSGGFGYTRQPAGFRPGGGAPRREAGKADHLTPAPTHDQRIYFPGEPWRAPRGGVTPQDAPPAAATYDSGPMCTECPYSTMEA